MYAIRSYYDLFIELDAAEEQLDFPVVYASAKAGTASVKLEDEMTDITPLFDAIIEHVPAPEGEPEGPLQMLVSSIDYDDYLGRIAIGRIERGMAQRNMAAALCRQDGTTQNVKITRLYEFSGLRRKETESARFRNNFV